jgi:hypothetical protein
VPVISMAHAITHSDHDDAERVPDEDPDPSVVSGPPEPELTPLPLRRLLGVATLTPEQAVFVASGVLRSLASLHDSGLVHGQLDADCVLVSPEGDVALEGWGVGAGEAGVSDVDADYAAVRKIVANLTRNADRPVSRRRPSGAALLDALERCRIDDSTGATVADRLDAALAAALDDENQLNVEQVRAEVAALIRAIIAPRRSVAVPPKPPISVPLPPTNPSPTAPTAAPAPSEPAPASEPAVRTLAARPTGRSLRTRLYLAGGAAVAVLAAVIGLTIAQSGNGTKTAAQTPAPSAPVTHATNPSAKPSNGLVPVNVGAPAHAGAITAVKLRADEPCRPNKSCTLRVRIGIEPGALSQLTWKLRAYDRCTGDATTLETGVMVAEPSWTSVYADVTASLPRGRVLSLVALTKTPDAAASRPLTVPSGAHSC